MLIHLSLYIYTPRVQVPNNHILSKILTYIATILNPSILLLDPLDPWGMYVYIYIHYVFIFRR